MLRWGDRSLECVLCSGGLGSSLLSSASSPNLGTASEGRAMGTAVPCSGGTIGAVSTLLGYCIC